MRDFGGQIDENEYQWMIGICCAGAGLETDDVLVSKGIWRLGPSEDTVQKGQVFGLESELMA